MRHRKAGLKLNRTPSHRKAMFRNMVTSLFKYDRIQTTGAKAKELRRWADHLITLAKRGDLHARRQALAIVREKDVVHKLFENAAERFGGVSGGYTRIVKLGRRPGDAAPVSMIELVISQDTKKKKTKKKKTKAEAAPKKAAADKIPAAEEKTEKAEDKKPKKSAKAKDAAAEKEAKTRAKAKKTAKVKDEPKDAGDAKEEKLAAKQAAKKKAAAGKAEKTTKAAREKEAAAQKEDTPDTKQKKKSTKKTVEDDK
ncbi:MAG: 50S ribosomal protein L17 [Desulfobacterales bacterium]|nr:MAG: 50S ribosomal protein L17 [Desulfobacterales bacterium]